MGQTYTVEIDLRFPTTDPDGLRFGDKLREVFAELEARGGSGWEVRDSKTTRELIDMLLGRERNGGCMSYSIGDDSTEHWSSDFYGAYYWQGILADSFDRAAPETEYCDIWVYPDSGYLHWQNNHGELKMSYK